MSQWRIVPQATSRVLASLAPTFGSWAPAVVTSVGTGRRTFAGEAKPAAPAAAKPAAKGGAGGGDKKKVKGKPAMKLPDFKVLYGHGADDRPERETERAAALGARAHALAEAGLLDKAALTGAAVADDPVLKAKLDAEKEILVEPLPADAAAGLQEPSELSRLVLTKRYASGALNIPEQFKGRVSVSDASEEQAMLTDEEGEDPAIARRAKRSGSGSGSGIERIVLPSVGAAADADAAASEMAAALLKKAQAAGKDIKGASPWTEADGKLKSAARLAGLPDDAAGERLARLSRGLPAEEGDEEYAIAKTAWEQESGRRLRGPWGDDINKVPAGILEELSHPYDFYGGQVKAEEEDTLSQRELAMTPEERAVNDQRKKLRDLIEKPLPINTRPIWPLYGLITGVDQVQQITAGGMIASTRCMVVVGNGMGGVGVGVAKHKEAFAATKRALQNAQRDMIHVPTHKGQLYHDVIGRKNNVFVVMRAVPASSNVINAAPLVQDILELAGIKRASAKILGSHRRNPYIVTQAVFDAFNHIYPPEREAYLRGLRLTWATADRLNPRTVFPHSPSGPRFPPAVDRHQTGRMRP